MSNCKVIALTNQKGGVGKTTTAVNLGVSLAQQGKKVLLIDADAQANLTMSLGYNRPDDLPVTLSTIMQDIIDDKSVDVAQGILHHGEGVDLLPSNIELSGLEVRLINAISRESVLKTCVNEVKKNYDYCLIDCMPSLGMLTINALAVADSVVIPTQPHYLSAKGLELLLRSVSKVRRQINPPLRIDGILMTNAYYNVQGEYEDYGECRRYILLYPAGSATGTMSDLVRFAKAFLQDSSECPLFTQADTLSVMLSPTLTFSGTDTPRICHGLFSQRYGVSLIGHAGNTTGFSANLVLDTEGGTGMVVMTNEVGETTYNYGLVSLVYGDCKEETGFTYDDISGIYLNSRANYKSSFTKLYSMISGLLPISKGETEGSFTAAMVGTVTQISKDACIMDDGNGLKTYLSIQRDDNGNVVALQHMTGMDFQKENTICFAIKVIFFCLFVFSSLWTLIMLIVHGVTLHRFKQTDIWKKKRYQLLAELFIVLASALIYWLILPSLMGGSLAKGQVIVKCVMIIIFSLAEIATLVFGLFGGMDKEHIEKMQIHSEKHNHRGKLRQKTGFIITRISGIILVANVLYWHFYQFWGC